MRVQPLLLFFAAVCFAGLDTTAARAGDISGCIIIAKRLTRRAITPLAYEHRGIAVPISDDSGSAGRSASQTAQECARVVVYLNGPNLPPARPEAATISQKDHHFDPQIVGVAVGSTVSFPNEDPIFHNVFSLSKAKQFDLGYYPEGRTRLVRFEKPGIVQVYCHLHPNMSAAVLVVPNEWHTTPGEDGAFGLAHVPAGRYQVIAWHRSAGAFKRWIEVPAAGTVEIEITIPITDPDQAAQ